MSHGRKITNPVLYTLAVQLLVVLPVCALILAFNKLVATSFMLGAIVYVVPNAYFTLYAFRYRGSESAHQIVRSFNTGEYGKLALAAMGFALVYRFVTPLHAPAMFAGFCSMIVLQWFIAYQVAARYKT